MLGSLWSIGLYKHVSIELLLCELRLNDFVSVVFEVIG
jgi:hypothetical protein